MKRKFKVFVSLLMVLSLINAYAIAPSAALASTLSKATSSEFSADYISADEDKDASLVTYGVDTDGVPFAMRQDGAKAKYLSISPKQFKMQIFKGNYLGEVVFRKTPDRGVAASFKASNKESLTAQATLPTVGSQFQKTGINLSLRYTKGGKSLKTSLHLEERSGTQGKGEELQKIINEVRASESLTKLLATARIFSHFELVKHAYAPVVVEDSCFWAATSCVASLVEYGLGIALIADVCGLTFGVGCLLALLFHPVAGVLVAKHCSDALSICNISGPGGGGGGPTKEPIQP
jgi:hypothetical protein